MTKADKELVKNICDRSLKVFDEADPTELLDVYVISIYVEEEYVEEEGRCFPELRLGWNTNTRWKQCCPKSGQKRRASSAGEAKWNYAFWLQKESNLLGGGNAGAERKLKDDWMLANGLDFTLVQLGGDEEEYFRRLDLRGEALWQISAELANQLRANDKFISIFGHSIPIIVHEVHMDGCETEYVKQANQDGQAEDYFNWTAVDPYTKGS